MPCCDTGRNIQKYKGAAASTLQDVTDNGNTTTGDIITTSGFFIGDGSLLTGIAGASSAFSFQDTSDRGNTTSNTIQFTNTITSLTTSGNVIVAGNVTAFSFYGLGSGLSSLNAGNISSGTLSNDRLGTKTGTGNIVMSASPTLSGTITGGTFSGSHSGDGSGLSSLNAGNISSGTLSNDRLGTKTGTGNIVMSASPTLSGTITGGTFSGSHSGDGSGLSSLNAGNISSGTLSISRGGTDITTYAKGDILVASDTNTLSNLALGEDSHVLTANTSTGKPEWKSASDIGTTVETLSNTAYIIGGSYNGGSPKTWSLKASTTNSADHIVIRDNNGNINVSALNVGGTSLTSTAWSGNSATATRLASTVNIGGVPFDGTGNIELPGVDISGSQDTTGKAGSIANAIDTASSSEQSVAFLNGNQVKTNTNLTFKPNSNELKLTNLKITGALTAGSSTGSSGQVLKSTGTGVEWGTDNTGGSGSGSSVWLQSGSTPNYIVTTPTPQSNVGISNTYEVTHTLHIGSNVIVSDTGGHDVLRVNGNVFCTNYLFGDGSKIRNLNTIRTETGANQISVGSDDGGPVLSWRERQIRYQRGSGRPDPPNYGF